MFLASGALWLLSFLRTGGGATGATTVLFSCFASATGGFAGNGADTVTAGPLSSCGAASYPLSILCVICLASDLSGAPPIMPSTLLWLSLVLSFLGCPSLVYSSFLALAWGFFLLLMTCLPLPLVFYMVEGTPGMSSILTMGSSCSGLFLSPFLVTSSSSLAFSNCLWPVATLEVSDTYLCCMSYRRWASSSAVFCIFSTSVSPFLSSSGLVSSSSSSSSGSVLLVSSLM